MDFENLTKIAEEESRRVLADLPPEVTERLRDVPIFFERRPDAADEASGIYPDTLGLFDPGPAEMPVERIRLWLENIWDFAEGDEEIFLEEVGITLLHEIGHVVGWDEDDLEFRGLD